MKRKELSKEKKGGGVCGVKKGKSGGALLSHEVALAVPSAQRSLTAVFGMGTGVASLLKPPLLEEKAEFTTEQGKQTSFGASRDRDGQASRPIRIGQLHALLRFHTRPINLIVYEGPSADPKVRGNSYLGVGFPLRCFQRLSLPNIATQRCHWRDNWYTRGSSIPVLSY